MERMNEFDEMDVLSPVEQVVMDKNLAGTKGFLLGAAVVGAGVGLTYLIKKFKQRKEVVIEVIKPEEKGV